jgi:RNA polymerase sigma factor (sigma-70 family)
MSKYKGFLTYYNQFFEKVYRYIFFRVGRNRELAEDMTSEVFLKAMENFETFDQEKNFGVWVYRIAHNHLVDYFRKAKMDTVEIEEVIDLIKDKGDLVNELDVKLSMEQVMSQLESIPQLQKEVILLKYVNDLENEEIAKVLNTNEAHVRVLQSRALGNLKIKLSYNNN